MSKYETNIRVVFMQPSGKKKELEFNKLEELKKEIIGNFDEYWMQGSGDGFIQYFDNDVKCATLMIGPNLECGIYLHFINDINGSELLSMYNENDLTEVVETAEEIYASRGLFLPLETAWNAIFDFIKTGKPSLNVRWVTPDVIPEEGNW